MYLFDGSFRARPEQNLSGGRVVDKSSLLSKVHLERQKREELRANNTAATTCQSCMRMFLTRARLRRDLRKRFDEVLALERIPPIDNLVRCINFFFDKKMDSQRITLICELLIKQLKGIKLECCTSSVVAYRLAVFLKHLLSYIVYTLSEGLEAKQPLTKCYRLAEAITSVASDEEREGMGKFFHYVLNKGYLTYLRSFADLKVPPLLEPTTKAPTPISSTIFQMIVQPFYVSGIRQEVTSSIIDPFMSVPYSDPVRNYILPSLADLGSNLPLLDILTQLNKSLDDTTRPPNAWLLYSVAYLFTKVYGHGCSPSQELVQVYIGVLSKLIPSVEFLQSEPTNQSEESDDEDGTVEELMDTEEKQIREEALEVVNSPEHVQILLHSTEKLESSDRDVFRDICKICHSLLLSTKTTNMYFGLLRAVTNNTLFLRHLWFEILETKQASLFGQGMPLLQLLNRGIWLTQKENERIVPMLNVFCNLFKRYLFTVHDSEFFGEAEVASRSMPFSLSEMAEMSVLLRELCVGLVELAYPESRTAIKDMQQQTYDPKVWVSLFTVCVSLVRHIHSRDTRRPFCPAGTWTTNRIPLPISPQVMRVKKMQKPFVAPASLTKLQMEDGPPLTVREMRSSSVLHEVPFVVGFTDRVKLFQSLVQVDRITNQANSEFLAEGNISVRVRRNFLYEDAMDRLSYDNEPNIKKRVRVQMTNFVGLDEAGIDGGGIFREFMTELLKTAFDPNRGFFAITEDNMLYPNPNVKMVVEDYPKHFFFLGRVLGKALYENLLVELPLADFFLSKLLGQSSSSDINSLASLDSTLHKNLLSLRDYDGDFSELGLDFTIVSNEFGETKVTELKPGGSHIPVTSANKIEYIYLVADYKLNKQIQLQCGAFRQGLADVIPISWLRMFNYKELQVLISGAEVPIDIEDMKRHTVYAGAYSVDHQIIKNFWTIVEGLTDEQKRKLLKFVTSCSRPPLLGFKELHPPFCIQSAGLELRLPTASTCMNLLKLPEIGDYSLMKEKLLYALESGSGFELS